ncbi:MAG TPA: branched-chain amino acid ABC transporter substrate-binding protein [Candidatus Dormibacteraeota bacterium]|nr:branched-chain amino acid ABC transporter substrate-binding protein [Candidatus Dormibacteraeota bacterium]
MIKIGVDMPLSGADAPEGIPTLNGIKLAIAEANAHTPRGFTFQLESLDDSVGGVHNPQQGATNIRSLAADAAVLGIIGPYNSNVAAAEIPVSNEAGLPLISPDVTNPTLTTAKYRPVHPDQITFFRVGGTDTLQGKAGAIFAKQLGFKRVYIVDDNETYGLGLANVFASNFAAEGGTVLGHDHITAGQQDFKALLTKIAAMHPDAVYYGGDASTGGGLLRQQMPSVGLDPSKVAFLGGDGISNAGFIKIAGAAANGTFYTVAAPNAAQSPAAQAFIRSYKSEFGDTLGPFSANAYVATQVLIAAIDTAIHDLGGKMPTRAAVLTNLRNTKNFRSLIGSFSFDANGDTNNPIISLWQVKNGKQVFVRQANIAASK